MNPTSIDSLLEVWEKLGKMERATLCTLAHRLHAGQRKYGKLEDNEKEWKWEAAEECLDASVYLAAGLITLTSESKRRYFDSLKGPNPLSDGDRATLPGKPEGIPLPSYQWWEADGKSGAV